MHQIDKAQAVEIAREFLTNQGEIINELLHATHVTKEMYDEELEWKHEHGNFLVEFSVVVPKDAAFAPQYPNGEVMCAVRVNDQTGEANYVIQL